MTDGTTVHPPTLPPVLSGLRRRPHLHNAAPFATKDAEHQPHGLHGDARVALFRDAVNNGFRAAMEAEGSIGV